MPITPQMLEMATAFRQALLLRERQAATRLVTAYGQVWQRLQGDIDALRLNITQMQAAGETVTQAMIQRLDRMHALQSQAAAEIGRFAEYADVTITAAQREAIAAGERDAPELVRAAFPRNSVRVQFGRMPTSAVEAMVGTLQDGSPLRTLLQQAVGDAAQNLADVLVNGLALGKNPRVIAQEIRSAFGMGLTRALRIARTEQLRAYRTATLFDYRNSGGIVKGWERSATIDDRTCMACLMLDGKVYSLEEEMDDHPQGRCVALPITVTYAELGIDAPEPEFQREMGADWFERQDEATQRAMMGNGMYDAWRAGQFQLGDIPKLREDATWGNSWVPKSLQELTGDRLSD